MSVRDPGGAGIWRLRASRVLGLEIAVAGLASDGGLGQGGGGDADGAPAGADGRDEVGVTPSGGAGGGFAVPPQRHGLGQVAELAGVGDLGNVGDGGAGPAIAV